MSQFKGKPAVINMSPAEFASKFDDLSVMQQNLDRLPEDKRRQLEQVTFTKDTISLATPQVGTITFRLTEHSPERVAFKAEGAPVPIDMVADLSAVDGGTKTEVVTSIDVDIPAFLRPMVSGPLQKAADQFGTMLGSLS